MNKDIRNIFCRWLKNIWALHFIFILHVNDVLYMIDRRKGEKKRENERENLVEEKIEDEYKTFSKAWRNLFLSGL